jgi:hypothetical protein
MQAHRRDGIALLAPLLFDPQPRDQIVDFLFHGGKADHRIEVVDGGFDGSRRGLRRNFQHAHRGGRNARARHPGGGNSSLSEANRDVSQGNTGQQNRNDRADFGQARER